MPLILFPPRPTLPIPEVQISATVPSPPSSGEKGAVRPDEGAASGGSVPSRSSVPRLASRLRQSPSGSVSTIRQADWASVSRTILSFLLMAIIICPRVQAHDRKDSHPLSPELHARCLEILRTGLQSDEFWPAMHAAEAMTLAGVGAEVIIALRDRVSEEKDDQHRCGLARELARAGDKRHTAVMFQILGDLKSTGRTHAAESLYKIGETGDGTLLRAAMSQSDVIPLQIMAAGALAKSGDESAFALLRAKLQSTDQTSRNLSAWLIGRLGNESDIPALLAALQKEKDEMSRAFLAVALACLGNETGRQILGEYLNSENVTARTMAAEFVGHSRSIEFREKLIRMLDDAALDVRVRSAQSLIALSMPASDP